jgi:hypothetical protein
MKIIKRELLSETKQDEAIEEQHGDLSSKLHQTSTMLKTLSSTRTTDQAQEEIFHREEEEGEEDHQKCRTMIQEIHTSTADIMVGAIAPKCAQKPKRT